MAEGTSDKREQSVRSALAGLVLMLVGALTLGALVYISNSRSEGAAHLMISLGLAGSAMLSAIAQGLVFLGGWMLWKATRRQAR